MTKIDLSKLTAEERRQILLDLQKEEAEAEAQKKNDIQAYKDLVDQTIRECFPKLEGVSANLGAVKRQVRDSFKAALDIKAKLYGIKDGQESHQYISKDGKMRIRIGYNSLDNYDDTVETGIAMVKEYLSELGDSENAQQAVKLALSLLTKDKKGNLKASRIMTLRKHAIESGNEKFIEGVDIIMSAYKPIESKEYIRAEKKNDEGIWMAVPLGMTEAE